MNKKILLGIIAIIFLALPLIISADVGCCLNDELNSGAYYCRGPNEPPLTGPLDCCDGQQSCTEWDNTRSCADIAVCTNKVFGCCCIGSGGIPSEQTACEGNGYVFTPDPAYSTPAACLAYCKTSGRGENCAVDYWNISLVPVKGEEKIQVSVSGCTPMQEYGIERCYTDGTNCEGIILSSTSTGIFIDEGVDWGRTYTYTVKSDGEFKTSGEIYSGDFECAGYESNEKFCIPSEYYIREQEFRNYDYFDGVVDFSDKVEERIVQKPFKNMPVTCNAENRMVVAGPPCGNGACAINKKDNTLTCINETGCQNITPTNIFGMSFNNLTCETNISNNIPKYCFFDKSETTADYCYQCKPEMSCEDYKSSYACNKDNCYLNRCAWNTTNPTMNTGVCVTINSGENCKWCTQPGTESMQNINVFNKIFDSCNAKKASALSTIYGYCIYKSDGTSQSCAETTCLDYSLDQKSCTGTLNNFAIEKNDYFELTKKSNDACNIGVCEYHTALVPSKDLSTSDWGGCRKNADADSLYQPDCAPEDMTCELDYFAPSTEIIETKYNKGCPTQFQIRIRDKTIFVDNAKIITTDSRYKTYFCKGAACIGLNSLDVFPIVTNQTTLKVVNGLNLTEASGKSLLHLVEGELTGEKNMIWYYTKDPSGNLGLKKNFTFYSSETCAVLTYNAIIK